MDLDMFTHLGEWTGNDWSNFFTILGGLAIIVGAIWTGIQFIRRRIARLEENIKANVQIMLQNEMAQTLQPMVEAAVSRELRMQRDTLARLETGIAHITHDMGLAQATIDGLRENREHLAQLHQTVQDVSNKAEVGYRYVRYLQQGNTLTKMRIAAKGAAWCQQAVTTQHMSDGPDKAIQEKTLFDTLLDICEPVIANAVVNESQTLTPADPGYAGIVDAYATKAGIESSPWPEREQALHERLTVSCVKNLQGEMYSFLPAAPGNTPPDFYTQIVKICTFAVMSDIVALKRGTPLP
jgi:hypothetical protein